MAQNTIEAVQVFRGGHQDAASALFGPLPGLRLGNVVAYEFELPESFEPWPGRTRLERTFVLLDMGVSFANPCWFRHTTRDGRTVEVDPLGRDSWYVDLIRVDVEGDRHVLRDLYIDLIVPTDGRPYRLLDLDEYAQAITAGHLSAPDAADGLLRLQRFVDRHLHAGRWPTSAWSDFPPRAIAELATRPAPFTPPVRWTE